MSCARLAESLDLRETDAALFVFVRRAWVRFNQKTEDFDGF